MNLIISLKKIRLRRNAILVSLLVATALGGLFLINRHNYNTGYWEGEGMINLFPVGADSKNYRLSAHMSVEMRPRGIYGNKKTFDIYYVNWPNGGKTYFEECKIIPVENKHSCFDSDSREWMAEIQSEPDPYEWYGPSPREW